MNLSAADRICLVILMLLSGLPVSFAQENAKPVVNVEREDFHFKVYASIDLPVTPCIAYQLLTDYSSLPGYIPGMLQIRHKRISPSRVDVWQEGEVEVLLFSVKLVSSLEMEEIPDRRIIFKQTEGDLESYRGEWNLSQTREGTKVSYNASITLKQDYFIPAILAKKVLENEIGVRFEAIAREASKRKGSIVPDCAAK